MLLSGILSRPWSPLSSLPPEVDVPLPLGFDRDAAPVVGADWGVDELAAGSPVVDPRPLGPPVVWAWAETAQRERAEAKAIVVSFIVSSFRKSMKLIEQRRECSGSGGGGSRWLFVRRCAN